MKVYVAEAGLYEDRSVAGVFDSPERAMAALPGNHWRKTTWTWFEGPPEDRRTVVTHTVTWANDLDWGGHVEIREVDLTDQGPTRPVDEAVVQTYRESDGGWDYPPEPGLAAPKLGEALG